MIGKDLPPHRVLTRAELGTNYIVHAIECEGARIHSQIGPYGVGEVEERVRQYVLSGGRDARNNPPTVPPLPPSIKRRFASGRKS